MIVRQSVEADAPVYASVIIPAFNEEAAIGTTLDQLIEVPEQSPRRYEILVVDDGSADATAERAAREGVRLIRRRRNRGYGSALKTGVLGASGEIVVFYDADDSVRPARH